MFIILYDSNSNNNVRSSYKLKKCRQVVFTGCMYNNNIYTCTRCLKYIFDKMYALYERIITIKYKSVSGLDFSVIFN